MLLVYQVTTERRVIANSRKKRSTYLTEIGEVRVGNVESEVTTVEISDDLAAKIRDSTRAVMIRRYGAKGEAGKELRVLADWSALPLDERIDFVRQLLTRDVNRHVPKPRPRKKVVHRWVKESTTRGFWSQPTYKIRTQLAAEEARFWEQPQGHFYEMMERERVLSLARGFSAIQYGPFVTEEGEVVTPPLYYFPEPEEEKERLPAEKEQEEEEEELTEQAVAVGARARRDDGSLVRPKVVQVVANLVTGRTNVMAISFELDKKNETLFNEDFIGKGTQVAAIVIRASSNNLDDLPGKVIRFEIDVDADLNPKTTTADAGVDTWFKTTLSSVVSTVTTDNLYPVHVVVDMAFADNESKKYVAKVLQTRLVTPLSPKIVSFTFVNHEPPLFLGTVEYITPMEINLNPATKKRYIEVPYK